MLQFALIHNRDRLKAPMRMLTYTTTMLRGRKVGRPCIIQQNEWTDMPA
jgi:hypothetical protein